ncbi:LOW QUALITY PROTEIN: AT-rich interactive domain-containing protein 4A [Centropristis striata]|uniref:LOW QUALITY PROTEIN: AT-rich interactive domain-containing protein 4A n=1 Tax=Centropristis striata TaxID=184440 RepID=UPI0027E11A69|nr:LOW QUALITY PROTEIN: AT-rich interactive domain-containing protein 4A [Centropristis striata]
MKAADEPAYLTVGTDVSAKYRGAFCEAKIKTVKRLVKVKVNLKGESVSQVVHDDQVKGVLRVGSTVEVKTNEGLSSEAVISKLTDASLYTVVFDDGDEKTLRRTSLCLKGERHFAESETLDQLPLTNPEHFGTPVIGKKSNRGGRRSSQAVADEENESSSSEDEEDDRRRLNDELLGKVCSIEDEEEPSSWYLALVVSPSCNDELVVKKDQCLVRAFSDAKFHTVVRRHVHIVSSSRSEFTSRRGFEAAQVFQRTGEVPAVWKMDMSQILDSSSSDDEDEEKESEEDEEDEDKKKKKKHIKEEPEEELDPEERDLFLQQLYKFMEDRGTPINKPPVLGYKDLNLFKLFRLVFVQGGCHKIESGTVWKQIYMDLGIPVLNSAASYNVKTAYKKYLYGFEEYCRSAAITFRTIHHNNPRPPATLPSQAPPGAEPDQPTMPTPPAKEEPDDDKKEEVESESESDKEDEEEVKERQSSPRGRRRCVGSQVKAERESPSRPERGGGGGGEHSEEQREVRRRSNRRMEDSERGSEEEEEDDDDDDDEDEEEEEEEERRRGDGEEEEDGDSVTGTKVRVKYGRGKTQKIYEAHIKKTDVDNGEQFYLVHYYGWNVRYDEWVKADRIIWPVEKGMKKRRRKKVKNKDEPERDRDEDKPPSLALAKPLGAKRGRPQIRTPPTGAAGRSVSKTPSTDGRSNGKRTETPSSMSNGDNTPRRRTRRTSGMYDSDRASNEDSGNSSEDSESEDPPDKKPSPWRGRPEAPPCPQEEEEQEEERAELPEVATMTANKEDAVATAAAGPPPVAMLPPPRPATPQETPDTLLSQSEKEEEELVEEPAVEAAMMLVQLDKDNKLSSLQEHATRTASLLQEHTTRTASLHETDKTSPGQEVPLMASPSRTPPLPAKTTSPDKPVSSPQPGAAEEDRSPALSPPRVKGRRTILREAGSDTPPRTPLCAASPSHVASPPRGILKRQDEPMVVLHCLPSQHLPPEAPAADSDTDSATEEEEEAGPEERSATLKRKAAEQRVADKKLRPDRRQEDATSPRTPPAPSKMGTGASPKTMPSPLRRGESERRSEGGMKTEDWPRPLEETPREPSEERLVGGATKEPEVPSGMPPPAPAAPGPSPAEELQIGPEALVCHEVDLDDPDEKEKPAPGPEHLLLMMREPQPAPPPLPSLLHASLPSSHSPHLPQMQLRPFLPAAAACPEELHPARNACEEDDRGAARAEQEGDSSPGFDGSASSSTTSLVSLQETKDRGQKRVMDCNSSPTAKKQKRNQKRLSTPGKVEKNGAGHSSDSEDQSRLSLSQKSQKSRCLSSPSTHKDKHNFSPQRTYKWTFQIDELDSMSSSERISFLQEKLQEIRKYYMTLKSEVASIDRRRKRLKKKEREVSNTTASTSSGSSDGAMSPSSASPTQNTVAVECR